MAKRCKKSIWKDKKQDAELCIDEKGRYRLQYGDKADMPEHRDGKILWSFPERVPPKLKKDIEKQILQRETVFKGITHISCYTQDADLSGRIEKICHLQGHEKKKDAKRVTVDRLTIGKIKTILGFKGKRMGITTTEEDLECRLEHRGFNNVVLVCRTEKDWKLGKK